MVLSTLQYNHVTRRAIRGVLHFLRELTQVRSHLTFDHSFQKTNFNLSLGQTRQIFHESNDGDEFFYPHD